MYLLVLPFRFSQLNLTPYRIYNPAGARTTLQTVPRSSFLDLMLIKLQVYPYKGDFRIEKLKISYGIMSNNELYQRIHCGSAPHIQL